MPINVRASLSKKTEEVISQDPLLLSCKGKPPQEIKEILATRGLNPVELLETVQFLTIAVVHLLEKDLK